MGMTYVSYYSSYLVPATSDEVAIKQLDLPAGTYMVTANIKCWVTMGSTLLYSRLDPDANCVDRRMSNNSVTENNINLSCIINSANNITLNVMINHNDSMGTRTFASEIKAVRVN